MTTAILTLKGSKAELQVVARRLGLKSSGTTLEISLDGSACHVKQEAEQLRATGLVDSERW